MLCTPSTHHRGRFVTAASLFDGHDAAINIMRRLLQAQGAEVVHLGPQPVRRRGRHRRHPGGRPGGGRQLLPGRPHRVLQLPGRPAPGRRAAATSGSTAGVAGPSSPPRSTSCSATAWPGSSPPGRPGAWAWRPWSTLMIAECDQPRPPPDRGGPRGPLAGDHRALARVITPSRPAALTAAARRLIAEAASPAPGPGARHHRHRRLGQIVADRRAGPPVSPRPGGQAARRRPGHRPDPAQAEAGPSSATASG